MKRVSSQRCFGGRQEIWVHRSQAVGVSMRFGIFLPEATQAGPCPVLWYLSGLTCTEQNVITKAGLQQHCAVHGLILVAPDTSPRGAEVTDAPHYDLGQGAGFYVNATQAPWASHYRMYDYVVDELPELIRATFPASRAQGIMGHSMGGHGALVIGLRESAQYQSISALAPILNPSATPWGRKAFTAYLGDDETTWAAYDASTLVGAAPTQRPLLIDQGLGDQFLAEQLMPGRFLQSCATAGQPVRFRLQQGYDHSYFFVSTFAADHVEHHASVLCRPSQARHR